MVAITIGLRIQRWVNHGPDLEELMIYWAKQTYMCYKSDVYSMPWQQSGGT